MPKRPPEPAAAKPPTPHHDRCYCLPCRVSRSAKNAKVAKATRGPKLKPFTASVEIPFEPGELVMSRSALDKLAKYKAQPTGTGAVSPVLRLGEPASGGVGRTDAPIVRADNVKQARGGIQRRVAKKGGRA